MERTPSLHGTMRPARGLKSTGRGRVAAFAIAAAVASAACLATLPHDTVGGNAPDGATVNTGAAHGIGAMGYEAHPWMATVLAPAYAQGDAYVITDLGNTFKLDIEQPPGINWTQVLLDRINRLREDTRSTTDTLRNTTDTLRGDTDALRDETRVSDQAIRDAISNFIRNNTAMLEERSRQFEQFRTVTNMSIADMISRDSMLNSTINQIVQNIYTESDDNEAIVSAISSQVHYVYHDSPARIMTCVNNNCATDGLGAVTTISSGTTGFAIYGDPSWAAPDTYTVSPIHYGAVYYKKYGDSADYFGMRTHPETMALFDHTMYHGFKTKNTNFGTPYPVPDYSANKPDGTGRMPHTDVFTWGCHIGALACRDGHIYAKAPLTSTLAARVPEGYPYHVNMISRETTPMAPVGHSLAAGSDIPAHINRGGTNANPRLNALFTTATLSPSTAETLQKIWGVSTTPFEHYGAEQVKDVNHPLVPEATHEITHDTNVLIGAGLSRTGALLPYFNSLSTQPSLPISGTTQTWPNCAHLPRCDPLKFAFERYDRAYETKYPHLKAWHVFISPQIEFSTWGPDNTVKGTYSASPQLIDRMSKRIITPTFQDTVPSAEAGKLYDIRGYVRIPFPSDTPINVTNVQLIPTAAPIDFAKIGRDYIADAANTKLNLYNLNDGELRKLGVYDCKHTIGHNYMNGVPYPVDHMACKWLVPKSNGFTGCAFPGVGSNACTTNAKLGEVLTLRPEFTAIKSASLPQLEGIYTNALYIPLVQGYSGFLLVMNGVGVSIDYKDIRTDNYMFLSPPRSDRVDQVSTSPIHRAMANVSATSQAVASRDGDMSIMAVVSATGSVDITNEYWVNAVPPRPPHTDPLSVTMDITINGVHYETKSIGINAQPAAVSTNTMETINLPNGAVDYLATRSVSYTYPSFVFAGTTSVPVSAGDHVLFELTANIDGEINEWTPSSTPHTMRGTSSAEVSINAASILMSVV